MSHDSRWRRIEEIYHAALERDESERPAFVKAACGDDDMLRREVESLLAEGAAEEFLATPALELAGREMGSEAVLIGRQLGPYQILSLLGAGGMGEVYRARDTKLGRDVAIKVLPSAVSQDADRVTRFAREARLLAALNHPNIAAIHGFEESDGISALVLELVEGETLADRIARGPIAMGDAIAIAKQVIDGLEAAHDNGIIHRDLKPSNIKLRPDGTVKILDFGLAKAMERAAGSSPNMSMSPTITTPAMAQAGMILGTAAYMPPEQARGKTVDKRADIWAFGVVLFEMLTARRAFEGEGISETLARVIEREPAWDRLPAQVSPALRTCLERCLQKDPRQRIRDIGDVRLALEGAFETGTLHPTAASSSVKGARLTWMAAAAAVVGMVALAIPAVRHLRETPLPEARPLHVSIVHTQGGEVAAPAISPDGRRVAYRARRGDGMPLLWVRDLASGDAQSLAGTEDASFPFWSPDSRDLGFFAGVALKRVSAAGGPVRVVTDALGPFGAFGGAWGADGTIAFGGGSGLSRVNADGGAATSLTESQSEDWSHLWPSFLPDGRRFLFTAKMWTRTAEASEQGIYLGALDSPTIRRLLPDLSSAVYAPPGYLVVRPRRHAHGGALRSRRGTRDRPAGRDRRGRGDRRRVLLRSHLCGGRRDARGATAAGGRAGQQRAERAQCGTASGRSQRHGPPRGRRAALHLLHGAQPGRQPHPGRVDR